MNLVHEGCQFCNKKLSEENAALKILVEKHREFLETIRRKTNEIAAKNEDPGFVAYADQLGKIIDGALK